MTATVDELLKDADRRQFVTLSREHVMAGRSKAGGWTRKQLALIGVDWPPLTGWVNRATGRRLPGSAVAAFIRMGAAGEEADLFPDAEPDSPPSPATPPAASFAAGELAELRAVARACRQAQRDGAGKAGGWEQMLDRLLGLEG